MGRLKSLWGLALACDECGLQSADMPSAHSFHVTTPTPPLPGVFFLPGWEVDMTWRGQFLLPKFLAFSAGFLSSVSWRVNTLLHFEGEINPALWRYHSLHSHCLTVALSTCFRSVSLKDNNWTISSAGVLGSFLKISRTLAFIIPVFWCGWFDCPGASVIVSSSGVPLSFLKRCKITGVLCKLHNRLVKFRRYSSSGGFVSSGARTSVSLFWE